MGLKSSYSKASEPNFNDKLIWNFYSWERLGRGWQVWSYPVQTEPPFIPFYHSDFPQNTESRKTSPSFFNRIADLFGLVSKDEEPFGTNPADFESSWSPEKAQEFKPSSIQHVLSISASPDKVVNIENAEHFLLSLNDAENPICFEIVGTSNAISLHIVCSDYDSAHVIQQLTAYFPDSVIEEREDYLRNAWDSVDEGIVIDFGLSQEFMRPIRFFNSLDPDPLIGVIGSLSDLQAGEVGVFQILFSATQNNWGESVMKAVFDDKGKPFFSDCCDMIKLSSEKVSRHLHAAVIRVAGLGNTEYDSIRIARSLASSLTPFSRPGSNELIPLDNADYCEDDHTHDLLNRQSRRSGMILNSRELVAFAHLPSASVKSSKLVRQLRKTKALPDSVMDHDLVLGDNIHRGNRHKVTLNLEQRLRHAHIIGATGTGKTTFILNMIVQDLEMGNGIAVLDPHGDLINSVMDRMPRDRIQDVVLIDPSDFEHPVGFNPLEAHTELERIAISSDFVEVFKRLSTSWGDQMTSVLSNAVLAFLESDIGGTLPDMRRFLIEKDFRQNFLKSIRDPEVTYFWEKSFPMLSGRPQGPILTRLDTFLRPKTIRRMISQKKGLDFSSLMDGKKIILAKLSQGLIGTENAYLLGTIFLSKIHQVALARQIQRSSDRVDFFVYVDEFQNFLTQSMAELLSGARKYNLGLILAHQDLRQLWERNKEIANSVISNPGTRVCFRVGDFDATKLEDGFSSFDRLDLQNLGLGEAIVRVEKAENDFNLTTYPNPKIDLKISAEKRAQIIDHSRQTYSEAIQVDIVADEPKVVPAQKPKPKPAKELAEIKQDIQESLPEVTIVPEIEKNDLEGSGGSEHRYLQTLIKKLAENLGFRAVIEEQTPDGKGKVDIGLEMSGRRIACEISLTSKHSQEIGNIQKCLDAGYDKVILCSQDKKSLSTLKKKASKKFNPSVQSKISYLSPHELILHLEQDAASNAGSDRKVKGWNVKVNFQTVSDDEKDLKKEALAKVILQAFQRLRR